MQLVVLPVDDVLANMEGGLDDDMSADEMARNAVLAEEHADLLMAHGYRLVRLPLSCQDMETAAKLHRTAALYMLDAALAKLHSQQLKSPITVCLHSHQHGYCAPCCLLIGHHTRPLTKFSNGFSRACS